MWGIKKKNTHVSSALIPQNQINPSGIWRYITFSCFELLLCGYLRLKKYKYFISFHILMKKACSFLIWLSNLGVIFSFLCRWSLMKWDEINEQFLAVSGLFSQRRVISPREWIVPSPWEQPHFIIWIIMTWFIIQFPGCKICKEALIPYQVNYTCLRIADALILWD